MLLREILSSSNFCDLLAAIVMEAPYSARATAQANPIPEDAPTISARLFFKENDGVVGKFISSFHPLLRYQETLIYLIPEVCGKHLFQLVYTYQEDQLRPSFL